MIVLKTN